MTVALIFPPLLEPQRAGIPALGFNPDDGQKALSENWMISELVAEVIGLSTDNGISTFNPPLLPDGLPGTPAYATAVRAYSAVHRLQGLCGLDLRRFSWSVDGG
jgi:hypothetical protein